MTCGPGGVHEPGELRIMNGLSEVKGIRVGPELLYYLGSAGFRNSTWIQD
jgi:hypothetical protein